MDLRSMTKEELIDYGDIEYGLKLNMRMSADTMCTRIEAESEIEKSAATIEKKTTRIIVAKTAGVGGDAPIPLCHNAVHTVISRGEPVDCPDYLLDILDAAVVQVEEQSDDGVFSHRTVQRYPYSVVR
ncbi:MAG: hypothetical protein R8K20_11910 [Gallionellaceae bacterium]